MTTIAYRDGILAADTQLTISNIKVFCSKIFVLRPGFILACAGSTDLEWKAMHFFKEPNWRQLDFPSMIPEGEEPSDKEEAKNIQIIAIENGIPFFCHENFIPIPIEHPFYAIGSGHELAMLGMHLGLTAPQAVITASELDVNTNDVVDYYDPQDGQIKRYQPRR